MSDVPRPREVTYNGTCQVWLSQGVRDRRILRTTWVHRCSVVAVSRQTAYGSAGHGDSLADVAKALESDQDAMRGESRRERTRVDHHLRILGFLVRIADAGEFLDEPRA